MLRLVYISTARRAFEQSELLALLRNSQRNNARREITGILLYHHNQFFQVLEGPEEAVRAVYARIAEDPRHQTVTKLYEERPAERLFGDWTMGFLPAESLAPAERLDFTSILATADRQLPERSVVRLLLKTFRAAPIR
ncbi:MAG TPA: BLUF domain-containing protein [Herpetosiphonaceae bacterium]|nr:BLUF domain-containing protein [Herpetosiphonaceae bacterium]